MGVANAYSVAAMVSGGSRGNKAPPGKMPKGPHIPRNPIDRAFHKVIGKAHRSLSASHTYKGGTKAYAADKKLFGRGPWTAERRARLTGGGGAMSGPFDSREGSWVKEADGKFGGSS